MSYKGDVQLPENLGWKIYALTDFVECWRVIHLLMERGYHPDRIKSIFPTIDDDYFHLITQHYEKYGMVEIEIVFKSIIKSYRDEEIKRIQKRMAKHEFKIDDIKAIEMKAWDKIDEIANEYGGHYVVPTVPGEVDTSEVSKFIQNNKLRLILNELKELNRSQKQLEQGQKQLKLGQVKLKKDVMSIQDNLINEIELQDVNQEED